MKKIFCVFLLCMCVFFNQSHAWIILGGADADFWGNPGAISGGWDRKDLPNVYIKPKKWPANAGDEAVAIVYMAQRLVAHGGMFCAVQPRSRNNGGGKTKNVWTIYQKVVGEPNCFWFCEPGYSGPECPKSADGGPECEKADISKSALSVAGYREEGGWDDYSIEAEIPFLWFGHKTDSKNEADGIVVAHEWLSNGRGIKAKPVGVIAYCGHNDGRCDKGNSDLKIIDSGGTERILCLPGWSGQGCTAASATCKVCQAGATWDNASQKCVCNEGTLAQGATCLSCDAGQYLSTKQGKCVTCTKFQTWNDVTQQCVDKKQYPMSILDKSACLTVFDSVEYKKCLESNQ